MCILPKRNAGKRFYFHKNSCIRTSVLSLVPCTCIYALVHVPTVWKVHYRSKAYRLHIGNVSTLSVKFLNKTQNDIIDWLIVYCLKCDSKTLHSNEDVTIVDEGLQNLDLALMVFEQEGFFIVPEVTYCYTFERRFLQCHLIDLLVSGRLEGQACGPVRLFWLGMQHYRRPVNL